MIAQDTAWPRDRSCDHTAMVTEPFFSSWAQNSTSFLLRTSCLPWLLYLLKRAMFGAELKANPFRTTLPFIPTGDQRWIFALILRKVPPYEMRCSDVPDK